MLAMLQTLVWFLLYSAAAVAAVAALGVFLLGIFFIRMMANNRAGSIDVRDRVVENDTIRKSGALSAQIEGDFVVFLIGAGVSNWWDLFAGQFGLTTTSMRAMRAELTSMPSEESGFLGGTGWLGNPTIQVQYWRSMEHLHNFARKPKGTHQTTWGRFNRYMSEFARGMHDDGGVGIWHEAFLVKDGNYEAIYNLMPPLGLGRIGTLVPAHGRTGNAAGRIQANRERTAAAAKQCPVNATSGKGVADSVDSAATCPVSKAH